ncbi:MAG TPA: GatB/YqeY domain-containing protein [Rhizomicrobium sp.]
MALRVEFNDALKDAMKARDQRRVSTLRMVLAALKDRDIANRTGENRAGIGDDEILTLLAKMIKQREESASAYESGGRPELAAGERDEIAIIRAFQPRQMTEQETRDAVSATLAETGASAMKDMGRVMAALKQHYAGQMDFGRAGGMVKELLAGR